LKWDTTGPAAARKERRLERGEAIPPLPELNVSLIPDARGVESLARQIKLTGRAYPLFEVAQVILKRADRYRPQFSVVRKADGQPVQPLWVCSLDETVWLSEPDAARHVLSKYFSTFYQVERTPTEPPKGTYTFVAQCGMSGAILGPPNYHDYQNRLRKLHAERFPQIPFEVYKSRVKIVRDEAVVKKWLEDQSYRTEYVCLNVPEPLRLTSREEVEKHFHETHSPVIIRQVDSFTPEGPAGLQALPRPLQVLLRRAVEEQRRFPLKLASVLSQQFAAHGLQFFKVNKTITHVAVARPHYLDMAAIPVSVNVRRIVEFINATPKCTRRMLLEVLAPPPTSPTTPVGQARDQEGQPCPPGQRPSVEPAAPSPEATAIIGDLHWLIHQGHVIEFANGILETARPPAPRPVKVKPEAQTPVAAPGTRGASEEATVSMASDGQTQTTANAAAAPPGEETRPSESLPAAALPGAPGEPASSAV
jgi:hypothetical protein